MCRVILRVHAVIQAGSIRRSNSPSSNWAFRFRLTLSSLRMRLSALTIGLVIVHGRWQRLAIASSYHRTRSAPFFISMACAVDLSKRDWKSAYPLAPAATCYFLDAPFPLVLLPPSQVRQSMNEGGYMRKKKHRVFAIAALAIIILALHPLVGLVFGDASATQPASYSFISLDIPNSSGELGFTSLADINNDGEITGGFTNSSGFGFLIGKTFSSTDIQCPGSLNPAVPNAQPQSINKHGEITGFCFTGGRLHGFCAIGRVNTLCLISLVPILPKPPE
jgi:hypothetical protein